MRGRRRFSLSVISTKGPAQAGRNGEISPGTRGATGGFTLIELLVVISIVVLLMAMLLPALSRARRQGRAVVCQANLKQWGLHGALITGENGGSFRRSNMDESLGAWYNLDTVSDIGNRSLSVWVCPMASRPAKDVIEGFANVVGGVDGGTFLAYGPLRRSEYMGRYGSYGRNPCHFDDSRKNGVIAIRGWHTTNIRNANRVPFMLDCTMISTGAIGKAEFDAPPQRDAVPLATRDTNQRSCINRHSGGVNGVFLDWSVRKVGLKELWTLKWYPQYDTAGPWTKAGGVTAGDWPAWMREFKDY